MSVLLVSKDVDYENHMLPKNSFICTFVSSITLEKIAISSSNFDHIENSIIVLILVKDKPTGSILASDWKFLIFFKHPGTNGIDTQFEITLVCFWNIVHANQFSRKTQSIRIIRPFVCLYDTFNCFLYMLAGHKFISYYNLLGIL